MLPTEQYEDYISDYFTGSCGRLMQKDGRTPEPHLSLKSIQTHRVQLFAAYKKQWRKPFDDKTSWAGLPYVFE